MQRIVLAGCAALAVLLAAAPGLAASTAPPAAEPPAAVPAEDGSCGEAVALETMSAAELERWMAEAGAEPLSRATGTTADPPRCPRRRACEYPCQLGLGPCHLIPFGSDRCCTSPLGPCFKCPEGQSIQIIRCPCVGPGDCPPHDQDWFCG